MPTRKKPVKPRSTAPLAPAPPAVTRTRRFLPALAAVAALALLGGLYWRLHRPSPAMERYQEGVRLASEGKGAEANLEWEAAVRLEPTFAPPYLAAADQERQAGRFGGAANVLGRLHQANPKYPHLQCQRAQLYGMVNRFETALSVARDAVQVEPNCSTAHNALGKLLEMGDNLPGAAEELKKAHALDPKDEALTLSMARMIALAGRPDEALAIVEETLPHTQYPVQANYLMGWLLAEYGHNRHPDLGQALPYLAKALLADPDHTASNTEFGIICLRRGKIVKAHEALERAYTRGPASLENLEAMVRLYKLEGSHYLAQATETLKQIEETLLPLRKARHRYLTNPEDLDNNVVLAGCELKAGNSLDAYDLLQAVLAEDPHHAAALALYKRVYHSDPPLTKAGG